MKSPRRSRFAPLRGFSLVAVAAFGILAEPASALIIDAFRVRGPSGANDEYIQVYNEAGTSHTVAALSGTGYGIAASDGITRCTIPNGTVIPSHGHYLCVNSGSYSLASYPAGNGTTATGDATFTTDIPDNAGIALFNNDTGGGSYILANRFDAVGSTSEANTLYKEGTGYPALTPFSIDYSFVRDQCGRGGAISATGLCPAGTGSVAIDTDNNAADFYFVDTNGTSAGAGQRLGAPGPQNLSSPINGSSPVTHAALDDCAADTAGPNMVNDLTSDPAQNSTFGTLDVRRTYTNNTGAPVTRLRFRVTDLTTFPAPSGTADLRPRTSTALVVTVDRAPCGSTSNVTVEGTTLEQPPSQPNGGGFYSTFSAGTVTTGTPLAAGASIDVRFLFGIQQSGNARFALAVEALPEGSSLFQFNNCVSACSADLAITKTDGVTTATPGGSVTYTITATNAGPATANGAQVQDTLPASLTGTWTCLGAGGGTCTAAGAGNINDSVNLPSGGSVTYTVSATISASATGTLSNTATVTAPAGITDPTPGNNSATDSDTLTPQADLAITKTDGVVSVTPGGSTTYTITASNAGPSSVTGATVADTFPAVLTVTWTCTGAGGGTCTAAGAGNINDSVNLPAGGSVTYTASATISGAAAGSLSNTATVTAPGGVTDPVPGNNSATDTDTVTALAVVTYTAPSPTGSGLITASFTGGGPGCTYATAAFVMPPAPVPTNLTFPHGMFDFSTTGCVVGSTLTFTITYPAALPPGMRIWKNGATPSDPTAHYYVLPATIVGNTATFSITDGGLGDDDLTANGSIVDPVGPALGFINQVPTLSQWAQLLLLLLMAGTAWIAMRRPN